MIRGWSDASQFFANWGLRAALPFTPALLHEPRSGSAARSALVSGHGGNLEIGHLASEICHRQSSRQRWEAKQMTDLRCPISDFKISNQQNSPPRTQRFMVPTRVRSWRSRLSMNRLNVQRSGLINTGLQPGESVADEARAASAALPASNAVETAPAIPGAAYTGLKPGVNERGHEAPG